MEKPALTPEQIVEINDMITYRKRLNMSQKRFAEELGVSISNIRYVEQQRQPISMSLREKIVSHKKELKYHIASMNDYKEVLMHTYAGNEAAKQIIPSIVEHIETISVSIDFDDKRKQTAYLNFLERTLAEFENICRQVASQIKNERSRNISGSVAGLEKAIMMQQSTSVKSYEK